jgi:hypothetical protein
MWNAIFSLAAFMFIIRLCHNLNFLLGLPLILLLLIEPLHIALQDTQYKSKVDWKT